MAAPTVPYRAPGTHDAGLLLLRLSLAAVMAAHGLLKVLVFGMPGTAAFFEQHGFPGWTAWPVMLAELLGAAALALGIGVRTASVVLVAVMLGATKVHAPNGWAFVNPGGGWEYPAFITAMLAALALTGGGRFTVRPPRVPRSTTALAGVLLLAVSLVMLPGCCQQPKDCPQAVGSQVDAVLARNRQLGERYFNEVWNAGRIDLLDALLTPDYVNHTPSTPNPPPGPDGLKPIVLAIRRGFPDLKYEIQDMIVTETRIVMRVAMTGTNTGELFGQPPTGRRVRVNQINIEEIRDGRIAEHWRVTEERQLDEQLHK